MEEARVTSHLPLGGSSETTALLADTAGDAGAVDGGEVVGPETPFAWPKAAVSCSHDAGFRWEFPG